MKSTGFYLTALVIALFVCGDVIVSASQYFGADITAFRTYVQTTSKIGISYGLQLAFLAVAGAILIAGVVKAHYEDKEIGS